MFSHLIQHDDYHFSHCSSVKSLERENILVSADSCMWHLQVRHVWQHSEQDIYEVWSQGSMWTLIPGLNPHSDTRSDDWPAFAQSHSQLHKWVLTVASEKSGFVPSASSACHLSSACPDVTMCGWQDVKIWYLTSVRGDPCVSCPPDAAGGISVCGLLCWRLLQICDHDSAIGLQSTFLVGCQFVTKFLSWFLQDWPFLNPLNQSLVVWTEHFFPNQPLL